MSDWSAIEALPSPKLMDLFAEDGDRLKTFSLDVSGIHFDWSKTHLTRDAVAALVARGVADDAGTHDRHRLWHLLILEQWLREWTPS